MGIKFLTGIVREDLRDLSPLLIEVSSMHSTVSATVLKVGL